MPTRNFIRPEGFFFLLENALLRLIDNVYDKAHFNYGHEPTIQIGRDAAVLGGRTAAGPITIRPS